MAVTLRQVHAIRLTLHSVANRSDIVWLEETAQLCVQLMNGRRTWQTT